MHFKLRKIKRGSEGKCVTTFYFERGKKAENRNNFLFNTALFFSIFILFSLSFSFIFVHKKKGKQRVLMSNNHRPNNNMYRGSNDPRLSQYQQQQMRQNGVRTSYQRQPQPQQYNIDPLSRPRPPIHRQQQPRQSHQPRPGRPVRPPVYHHQQPMPHPQQPGPHRRGSINRSRSLSRPERQRPRQGLIRSPSQQQRMMLMQQQQRQHMMRPPSSRPTNHPMPNRLQHQLQQQKMYQQQEAALLESNNNNNNNNSLPKKENTEEIPNEEKIKVLTSWWAWCAYLMTCCIPNWFLRVCLRKKNPMVQQAWREKVGIRTRMTVI